MTKNTQNFLIILSAALILLNACSGAGGSDSTSSSDAALEPENLNQQISQELQTELHFLILIMFFTDASGMMHL